MVQKIRRYFYPTLIAVGIAVVFFALPASYPPFIPHIGIFSSIGGLLFAADIAYYWDVFKQPVLEFKGVEAVRFNLAMQIEGSNPLKWTYAAQRIIVENVGRSAANNCKGWIAIRDRKERVAWVVSTERPNITINQRDSESLDFCAYYVNGSQNCPMHEGNHPVPYVIHSNENGWDSHPCNAELFPQSPIDQRAKVVITADNASPIEREVSFDAVGITFRPR